MNEVLPTKNVIGREKDFISYDGILSKNHPLRSLQERVLPVKTIGKDGKTITPPFSHSAEPAASLGQLKQKSGIGKYGDDLTDEQANKFYNALNQYFKEGATKKDITDYLKLIPATTGAAYITNKTNEK